jgi:hypothetical protein
VHRFAFQADEEREGVAVLFDADALGHDGDEAVGTGAAGTAAAPDAILHVLDADALLGTLRQVDHAETVQGGDGLLGIVIQVLANDEDGLAVAVAVRVRVRDVGREGNVAGHLLPEITELVARVPDVVAGGVDGVLLRAGVVTGAAGTNAPPMSDWPSKMPIGVSKFLLGR